jgi:hypothetical protein
MSRGYQEPVVKTKDGIARRKKRLRALTDPQTGAVKALNHDFTVVNPPNTGRS